LNIKQTFWYSADANRYLVKFEGGGAVGELRQISHHSAGEPATLEDSADGFSVSAPAGWVMDSGEPQDGAVAVTILDPVCASQGQLTIKPLSLIDTADKASLRALAAHGVKLRGQMHQNFVTQDDSWQDIVINGQPAVSVVSGYTEGNDKHTLWSVFTLGPTNAEAFDFATVSKDFAAFQPKFEAIVDSLKTK
jgi:hypothetical protein